MSVNVVKMRNVDDDDELELRGEVNVLYNLIRQL